MRSVKIFVVAGAASLLSSMAFAADMAIAPPPMSYGPPPAADFGGWYLRGDIGFSNQRVDNIRNTNAALYTGLTSFQEKTGFDTGGIYQIGAGYQFNHWFRVDVTGEYRGSTNFHGLDLIGFPGGFGADTYNASKSEWLFLANAYADLGTWWCITPYVGAGIGTARVAISNFTDTGINNSGAGATPSLVTAANGSQWNFAWALHAGLAYKVTPGVTLELAYHYLNLGDATTGVNSNFAGTATAQYPWTMHDITSHDLKLGVRWNLDNAPVYAPPPLIRKG